MYQLTLEWTEAEKHRSQTLSSDLSKLLTIGRDPSCDVVLHDQTRSVSGIHAGLYFDPKTLSFYIRNLTRDRLPPKQPNPIWVNGRKVIQEEFPIAPNSQIQLGRILLKVKSIEAVTKDRGSTLSQGSLEAPKVKCSRLQNPHYLPPEYQGQNCPYCGHLVLSATLVIPPPKLPKVAADEQTPSVRPKGSPNPNPV